VKIIGWRVVEGIARREGGGDNSIRAKYVEIRGRKGHGATGESGGDGLCVNMLVVIW